MSLSSFFFPDETILDYFEPIGCFQDGAARALPVLIKNFEKLLNWKDMNSSFLAIIHACAEMVSKENGFQYFAVQNYRECWSGENGGFTYNKLGQSDNCYEFGNYGVGGDWSNFVYRIVKG